MALTAQAVELTGAAAAVLLAENPAGGRVDKAMTVTVQNLSAADAHVGGPGVTASTGVLVAATSGEVTLTLLPGDRLYGYAATTATVRVLVNGA